MTQTFEDLLRKNFVDSQDTVWHTHVSMVQPRGKFQFNRTELENLWTVYGECVETDHGKIMGIAEKPHAYTPVLVDVDLKVKDDSKVQYGDHLYSENHVVKVVQVYQSVLRNIVDGCSDDNLTCVLLE